MGKEKRGLNEVGGEQRNGSGENKKLEVAGCLFQILVKQFNINGQAARKSQLEELEKQALCPRESGMSQTIRWEIYYEETNCAVLEGRGGCEVQRESPLGRLCYLPLQSHLPWWEEKKKAVRHCE